MTDLYDRAAEIEQFHRETAIRKQAEKNNPAAVSAYECEECGEPIPEERRTAQPGCQFCVACQARAEKTNKGARAR